MYKAGWLVYSYVVSDLSLSGSALSALHNLKATTVVTVLANYHGWVCQTLQNDPRFNLRASIFQNFPGGSMPPDLPSISMLRMLIVLCTIASLQSKGHLSCV